MSSADENIGGEPPLNKSGGSDKYNFGACEAWWGNGSPESHNEFWKHRFPEPPTPDITV